MRELIARLDGWQGEIVVKPDEIERRTRDIPAGVKRDIEFATERVRRFALAQRESIRRRTRDCSIHLFALLAAIAPGRSQSPDMTFSKIKRDLFFETFVRTSVH